MLGDKTVLGLIIARGGSKGLPGKNLAELGGKPLIAWTIEAAHASRFIDRTVLSTEDADIIAAARERGCDVPFVRDPALASDEATGTAVVLDAVARLPGYDYVVLLQATSPLRRAEDIDRALLRCQETGAPSCVTVTPLGKPLEWLMRIDDEGRLRPVADRDRPDRRQDASVVYSPNGAVYVILCTWLKKTGAVYGTETIAHIMPPERSVDIDTPYDLALARSLVTASTTAV